MSKTIAKWLQRRRNADSPRPKTRLSEQEALDRARALTADMALADLLCSAIAEETGNDDGRSSVIWRVTTTTIDTILIVTIDDATGDLIDVHYRSGFDRDEDRQS